MKALGGLLLLGTAACALGPRHLEDGQLAYNEALRDAFDKELLLNLVRLRYLETMEFVAITSISSQVEFSAGIGGSGGEEIGTTTAIGVVDVSYSNRPTITFLPQRGSEFARTFLRPLDLDILVRLAAAEYDLGLVLTLFVTNFNSIANYGDESAAFRDLARRLEVLRNDQHLSFGFLKETVPVSEPIPSDRISAADLVNAAEAGLRFQAIEGEDAMVLSRDSSQMILYIAPESPGREELLRDLGLRPIEKPYYSLKPGNDVIDLDLNTDEVLDIQARSMGEILSHLAGGVSVPPEHIDRGWAEANWWPTRADPHMSEVLNVRTSRSRPEARLAVEYRGRWFYIGEDDHASKLTFSMVAQIMRLNVSPALKESQAPVLTLPVGR